MIFSALIIDLGLYFEMLGRNCRYCYVASVLGMASIPARDPLFRKQLWGVRAMVSHEALWSHAEIPCVRVASAKFYEQAVAYGMIVFSALETIGISSRRCQ